MRSGGHCEGRPTFSTALMSFFLNRSIDNSFPDIDECELGKCDFETSTCMNLVGSYYCECLDGNYRETNFSCLGEPAFMPCFRSAKGI